MNDGAPSAPWSVVETDSNVGVHAESKIDWLTHNQI
jgi:hypothetical protein